MRPAGPGEPDAIAEKAQSLIAPHPGDSAATELLKGTDVLGGWPRGREVITARSADGTRNPSQVLTPGAAVQVGLPVH